MQADAVSDRTQMADYARRRKMKMREQIKQEMLMEMKQGKLQLPPLPNKPAPPRPQKSQQKAPAPAKLLSPKSAKVKMPPFQPGLIAKHTPGNDKFMSVNQSMNLIENFLAEITVDFNNNQSSQSNLSMRPPTTAMSVRHENAQGSHVITVVKSDHKPAAALPLIVKADAPELEPGLKIKEPEVDYLKSVSPPPPVNTTTAGEVVNANPAEKVVPPMRSLSPAAVTSPAASDFWKRTLSNKAVASTKYDIDKFAIRDPKRRSVVIRISELSDLAGKWWKRRIKLVDQPVQLRKVWKMQLDTTPGAMGVVDLKELRLFVEATLNNPNKEYVNKLDERLQLWVVNRWAHFKSTKMHQAEKLAEFVDKLMDLWDYNHTKQLSYEEFTQGLMSGLLTTGMDAQGHPVHDQNLLVVSSLASDTADPGELFGVIDWNMRAHGKKYLLEPDSCTCFSYQSPLRKACLWLAQWPLFDKFILLAIIANSFILALEDYQDLDRTGTRNKIADETEVIFTAIFTFECGIKIIALGFVSFPTAYLKNGWNVLDFVVVLVGLLGVLPGVPSLTSLRTFRVLRPLRTLSRLPGMRKLVGSLLQSIPGLFNVMTLLSFIFIIFGIMSVQLWNGKLHSICRSTAVPGADGVWPLSDEMRTCGNTKYSYQCATAWDGSGDTDGFCGSDDNAPAGHPATRQRPPADLNFGLTNFDHIGVACVTIFQIITMENWTPIMYMVQDSTNDYVLLYFLALVIFGSFFLLNMVLAIIWDNFSQFQGMDESDDPNDLDQHVHKLSADESDHALFDERLQRYGGKIGEMTVTLLWNSLDELHLCGVTPLGRVGTPEAGTAAAALDADETVTVDVASLNTLNSRRGSNVRFCERLESMTWKEPPADGQYQIWVKNASPVLKPALRLHFMVQITRGDVGLHEIRHYEWASGEEDRSAQVVLDGPLTWVNMDADQDTSRAVEELQSIERQIWVQSIWPGVPRLPPEEEWLPPPTLCQTCCSVGTDEPQFAWSRSNGFFTAIYRIVEHPLFNVLIMSCIILNTVVLSMDKYPEDLEEVRICENINEVLTYIFIAEMGLKILAFGPYGYCVDPLNLFDGFIVITSIVEIVQASMASGGDDSNSSISALRTFRAFRIFKLARSWRQLQRLLYKIVGTIRNSGNFILLLLLFMFIFSLIGMQFFANKFNFDQNTGDVLPTIASFNCAVAGKNKNNCSLVASLWEAPRGNFDTIGNAHLTVFQVLSGEDWNVIMYHGIIATGWSAVVYFIALVVIGSWIVLNLFLAILLGSGDGEDEEDEEDDHKHKKQDSLSLTSIMYHTMRRNKKKIEPEMDEDEDFGDGYNPDDEEHPVMKGTSLCVLTRHSGLRRFMYSIYRSQWFDFLILLAIFVSTVVLAIDSPLIDPNSDKADVLQHFNTGLFVIFVAEFVVRVIVLGVQGYIRDGWNQLDFAVLVISSVDFIPQLSSMTAENGGNMQAVRAMRALRALRPLRMISRAPGMKKVVDTMLATIPGAMNVIVVCSLFYLIFAIVGVTLFKGKYYHCDMGGFDAAQLETIDREFGLFKETYNKPFVEADCVAAGGEWMNQDANFDNVLMASWNLLEISTTEGWMDAMYTGVDATAIGENPVRGYNSNASLFFVAFIVVGNFFVLNLFVGAVCDSFNAYDVDGNKRQNEELFQTVEQKEWVETQLMISRARLQPKREKPRQGWRLYFYDLVHAERFEVMILTFITLNTICMGAKHHGEHLLFTDSMDMANYIFAVIYTLEACLKLIGMGTQYFESMWNKFDFLVVIGADVSIVLDVVFGLEVGAIASLARAFRMCQIVRLFKKAHTMQSLVNTMITNLPYLSNISCVLFLVLFIFSVMGMQLFAGTTLYEQENLTEHANFQDILMAFLTLFRCTTGEAWNSIMYDLMKQEDTDAAARGEFIPYFANGSCVKDANYSYNRAAQAYTNNPMFVAGCGPDIPMTYSFFVLFNLVASFIMINLFLAVILQGFTESADVDSTSLPPEVFRSLTRIWADFDPQANYHIKSCDVEGFFIQLDAQMRRLNRPISNESVLWDLANRGQVLPEVVLGMNVKGLHHKYGVPIVSIQDREMGVVQQGVPSGKGQRLGGILEFVYSLELPDYEHNGEGAVYFADVCKKLAMLMLVRRNKRRGMDELQLEAELRVAEEKIHSNVSAPVESKKNSYNGRCTYTLCPGEAIEDMCKQCRRGFKKGAPRKCRRINYQMRTVVPILLGQVRCYLAKKELMRRLRAKANMQDWHDHRTGLDEVSVHRCKLEQEALEVARQKKRQELHNRSAVAVALYEAAASPNSFFLKQGKRNKQQKIEGRVSEGRQDAASRSRQDVKHGSRQPSLGAAPAPTHAPAPAPAHVPAPGIGMAFGISAGAERMRVGESESVGAGTSVGEAARSSNRATAEFDGTSSSLNASNNPSAAVLQANKQMAVMLEELQSQLMEMQMLSSTASASSTLKKN